MLVSIIIPSYNVEDYIAECLDSAINQTYRPIEIIAVDNNSTDGTLAILRDYEKKYPDLITVLEEVKQGAPSARNKGLLVAKGEWVQFLDADDLLMPEKIRRQFALVESKPEINMVVGAYTFLNLNGNKSDYLPDTVDPFKAVMKTKLGNTVSNLFRRYAILEIGGWNEYSYGHQDTEMIFDLLVKYKTHTLIYDLVSNALKRKREFGQITNTNLPVYNYFCLQLRLKMIKTLLDIHPEYFHKNKQYFYDFLYYFIYRYGIYCPQQATTILCKELGCDYFPKEIGTNFISLHQKLIVRFFGFKNYMCVRNFLKTKFS